MNYELKSSLHKKKISWPVRIVIVITLILVLLHFILPSLLSTIITTIVSPLWRIDKNIGTGQVQLAESTKDIIIAQLTKENVELKETMNRVIDKNVIMAYILKKPPFTAYDSFILDVGSKDKIMKGDKVYANGNIIIGEVDQTFPDTSRVRLYSTYGEKYEVLIGDNNIQATATGRGGGSFEVVIPRDIKIVEGDIVTIPNISSSTFGVVGKIIADPARAFSTIIFSQPINIYEQKWVQIYEKTKSN